MADPDNGNDPDDEQVLRNIMGTIDPWFGIKLDIEALKPGMRVVLHRGNLRDDLRNPAFLTDPDLGLPAVIALAIEAVAAGRARFECHRHTHCDCTYSIVGA